MQKILIICTCMFLLVSTSSAFAEACTYSEAKLALQNGNQIRGLSLMKMAANDGDSRAISFLSRQDEKQVAKLDKKLYPIVANGNRSL